MKVIKTKIPDVKIIEPIVFGDQRGFLSANALLSEKDKKGHLLANIIEKINVR